MADWSVSIWNFLQQLKTSPLPQWLLPPDLTGWRLTVRDDGVPSIKSHDPFIEFSCEITWQTKVIIYPLPQCLWLPLSSMVTDTEGLVTIKSPNALIRWSCKVTRQTKIISSLPLCLWPPNLVKWWHNLRGSYL